MSHEERVAAWEAKRDAAWKAIVDRGLPTDRHFMATVCLGWSMLGGAYRHTFRAAVLKNKHGWPMVKPVNENGRTKALVVQGVRWLRFLPEAVLKFEEVD